MARHHIPTLADPFLPMLVGAARGRAARFCLGNACRSLTIHGHALLSCPSETSHGQPLRYRPLLAHALLPTQGTASGASHDLPILPLHSDAGRNGTSPSGPRLSCLAPTPQSGASLANPGPPMPDFTMRCVPALPDQYMPVRCIAVLGNPAWAKLAIPPLTMTVLSYPLPASPAAPIQNKTGLRAPSLAIPATSRHYTPRRCCPTHRLPLLSGLDPPVRGYAVHTVPALARLDRPRPCYPLHATPATARPLRTLLGNPAWTSLRLPLQDIACLTAPASPIPNRARRRKTLRSCRDSPWLGKPVPDFPLPSCPTTPGPTDARHDAAFLAGAFLP